MIFKGFKFGMLLQLAVGPMCLLVFNTSASEGILHGLTLVAAITIVDLIYITLSGLGAAAVINRKNVKTVVKIFGAVVLVLFGADMIAGALGHPLLPQIALFSDVSPQSIFLKGFLLTASNPLTIIFWSGVFSTQVAENNYNKKQLCGFGAGCVLSTLIFLSCVAVLGTAISGFIPQLIMQILNGAVGAVIIFFGIRLLIKREKPVTAPETAKE